jgi:hypothetical protein
MLSFLSIYWAGLESSTLLRRMASSGMLRHASLVITYVLEELSTSFIRVTRIGELGTTLAVTSNRRTLRRLGSHPGRRSGMSATDRLILTRTQLNSMLEKSCIRGEPPILGGRGGGAGITTQCKCMGCGLK